MATPSAPLRKLTVIQVSLGEAVAAQGDLGRARALHEEALAISQAQSGVVVATMQIRLAVLAAQEGDWSRAVALEREALARWDHTFTRGLALTFDEVCLMAAQRSQWERAVCLAAAADAIRQSLGTLEVPD